MISYTPQKSHLRKLHLIGGCSYKRFCSSYCRQVTTIQNPTESKQIRYNVIQTVYKFRPGSSFCSVSCLSLYILFLSSQLATITINCSLGKKPFVKNNQSTRLKNILLLWSISFSNSTCCRQLINTPFPRATSCPSFPYSFCEALFNGSTCIFSRGYVHAY